MTPTRSEIFDSTTAISSETVVVPASAPTPTVITIETSATTDEKPVNLDVARPSIAARLRVESDGEHNENYAIEGFYEGEKLPRMVVPRAGRQIVKVSNAEAMFETLDDLRYTEGRAADQSKALPFHRLALWVQKIREDAGDAEVALIIEEHTATGIPWEMLRVEPSHLGAVVTTVRWTEILDPKVPDPLPLEALPGHRRGRLASYPNTAPGAVNGWTPDLVKTLTDHVTTVTAMSTTCCDSLPAMRTHLREGRAEIALTYVLCHGETSDDRKSLRSLFGNDTLTYGQITRDRERVHPVVFINACNSGTSADERGLLPDFQLVGFPKPFLERGAAAVIGTIREVTLRHATRVGGTLLAALKAAPTKPLATLLRELRASAVEDLRKAIGVANENEALERWFYTFHYVLWGSPKITLVLE